MNAPWNFSGEDLTERPGLQGRGQQQQNSAALWKVTRGPVRQAHMFLPSPRQALLCPHGTTSGPLSSEAAVPAHDVSLDSVAPPLRLPEDSAEDEPIVCHCHMLSEGVLSPRLPLRNSFLCSPRSTDQLVMSSWAHGPGGWAAAA